MVYFLNIQYCFKLKTKFIFTSLQNGSGISTISLGKGLIGVSVRYFNNN